MPPNEESMKIAEKFHKYAKSSDKSHIEDVSFEKIEITLIQYARDKGTPHYSAMERRLEELREQKKELLTREEKNKERREGFRNGLFIGIFSTVIGGIILAILLKLAGLK